MPQYVSIFDKVRKSLPKKPLRQTKDQSIKWFRDKIKALGGTSKEHILMDPNRSKGWFYPGRMYLFSYDPKHKKTLPYYDRFPLVFPLELYNDGFLGINLHYLDHRRRLKLFESLLELRDRNGLTERTKLQLSYGVLKSMGNIWQPCIKRYLANHIVSHGIRIDAPDWETALFLPVEDFAKKSKTYVWNDSNSIISHGHISEEE